MRVVLFFLLLLNLSFASAVKNVYIVEDHPSITFDNIKTNKDFKRTTKHIQRQTDKEYWIRVEIDDSFLVDNQEYVFKVYSRFETNTIEFEENLQKSFFDSSVIEFRKSNLKELYLKVDNTEEYIDLAFNIYKKNDYYKEYLEKHVLFGIAYGIIFSAVLYYFAFFIFNRQASFIYYSLTQVCMLIMLLDITPNDDLAILGFLVFSNLFTKEFLNTKKYTPKLDIVLTLMIIYYVVDTLIHEGLSSYFPSSIFLVFYLFTAIIIYHETKFKPILFYIAGWGIVILSFMFIDFQFFFSEVLKNQVNFETLIHIIAPLESLILAFTLSYKMKLLEEEKLQAERMAIHQNKLASMGEMISNIAHQWRQPLTHLSYIFMNINSAFKHNKLDNSYLEDKTKEATLQLEYMSHTIDDFKDFYSLEKQKVDFSVKDEIKKAMNIISSTLDASDINIELKGEDFIISGYESEFSQVVLNLLTNAKDALLKNEIKSPEIIVFIKENQVDVLDNAGGIDEKIKDKIFDPYFTTKKQGSGIGLYMSTVIIQTHFNGKLIHNNQNQGSCFSIKLNID